VKAAQSNGQMSVRTQSILEILKTSGSMGIKDICSNLPEYSEKMIQRELSELVEVGTVQKTGLKRWSRYSVAP
jgi:DeoR/GlpR family transcriptional regulator of sugar metabolism